MLYNGCRRQNVSCDTCLTLYLLFLKVPPAMLQTFSDAVLHTFYLHF